MKINTDCIDEIISDMLDTPQAIAKELYLLRKLKVSLNDYHMLTDQSIEILEALEERRL